MLFDPVLEAILIDENLEVIDEEGLARPLDIICSHCYRPIEGKAYRVGTRYYDEYCWQFRYVLEPQLRPEHRPERKMREDEGK